MRPVVISADTPLSIEQFPVDWEALVTEGHAVAPDELPYLAAIARYTNDVGPPGGVFAHRFAFRADDAFDRLLGTVHGVPVLQKDFVPKLLARTAARDALTVFASDAASLEQALREAAFSRLSSFALEGALAEHLYYYGMYEHYYDHHDANDARCAARTFVEATLGDDVEQVVVFESRSPWGDWFDPHSCTDRTFVLLQRARRQLWLLCFSDSD